MCRGNKGPSLCRVGFLRDTPNSHSKPLLPARTLSPLCTERKLRLRLIPLSVFPDLCLCVADLAQEAAHPPLAHPLARVPPRRVAHSPGRPPCLLSGGVASVSITRLLGPPCALESSPFSPPRGSVHRSSGLHSQANVLQLPHPTWSHQQLGQSSCVTSCPRLPGRGSSSPRGQHLHGVTGCPQQLVALPKPGKLQETLGCLGCVWCCLFTPVGS